MDNLKTKPTNFLQKYGETIINNGYDIHPVKYGEKGIFENGWQNRRFVVEDLESYLSQQQTYGVSIITKNTPAVDIDVLHQGCVMKLRGYIQKNIIDPQLIAPTLIRVGQAPKCLMLFKTSEPFRKVTSPILIDLDGNENRVEILCVGQQFVGFNRHTKAQKDYKWLGDDTPLNVKADELAELTNQDAINIVNEFISIATELGWTIKGNGSTLTRSNANTVDFEDENFTRSLEFQDINNQLKSTDEQERKKIYLEVKAAIGYLFAQGDILTDRALWIRITHALACAKESPLEKVFHKLYEVITPDLVKDADRWHSCKPSDTNWRVILKSAKDRGWLHETTSNTKLSDKFFRSVSDLKITPNKWLIKSILEQDTTVLLYGEPGTFKSFLAIDFGLCIASGANWTGHKVSAGAVFCISGEGHRGFGRRTKAWGIDRELSLTNCPLYFGEHAVPLMNEQAAIEVIAHIEKVISEIDVIPKLIIIDTLHNCYSGNENDATDMGKFLHCLNQIKFKYKCTVLIVHHSGKASPGVARGSSSLKAGVDTEFHLSNKHGTVVLKNTKMKDAEIVNEQFFTPTIIELYDDNNELILDEDGKVITSVVLKKSSKEAIKKPPGGKNQIQIMAVMDELTDDFESNVTELHLRIKCCDGDKNEKLMQKKAFDVALKSLVDSKHLKLVNDCIELG